MDPLKHFICCDLRGRSVKCTHYRVSSFSHVTFTLFSFTHPVAQYFRPALAHITAFHFPFRRITLLLSLPSFSEALSTLNSNQHTLFPKSTGIARRGSTTTKYNKHPPCSQYFSFAFKITKRIAVLDKYIRDVFDSNKWKTENCN